MAQLGQNSKNDTVRSLFLKGTSPVAIAGDVVFSFLKSVVCCLTAFNVFLSICGLYLSSTSSGYFSSAFTISSSLRGSQPSLMLSS
jgi:hypothetical protein